MKGLFNNNHQQSSKSTKTTTRSSSSSGSSNSIINNKKNDDVDIGGGDGGVRKCCGGGCFHLKVTDADKPLSWTDPNGNTYHYYEHPMMKATIFVLLQEMCERLAFYGLTPNLQTFLKVNLGYSDSSANTYIADFQAIIYVTPLIAAVLSDTWLGVYNTILIFSVVYIIGLALFCVASVPRLCQPWMVHLSLMVLITLGSGGIKSCVNVMGAQQFHPELHKALITRFFTYFYSSINIGALVGGIVTPILVEDVSFFVAYLVPFFAFIIATAVFLYGGIMGRFVKPKPQGSAVLEVCKVIGYATYKLSLEKCKKSNGGPFEDRFIEDAKQIFRLIPLFTIIIPFTIAYDQMTTAWLTQAEKMNLDTFGWDMPAALMQNIDSVAIIINSLLIDGLLYSWLRSKNKMWSVLTRMCVGSLMGAASLLLSLAVEYAVMYRPLYTVSVWWQVPQFWVIAAGEIFLTSTSYEVAFTYSPSNLKAVSSAINLLFFAIANFIAGAIFQACSPWMPDFTPSDYPNSVMLYGSHYDYYYLLLAGICVLGALMCLALMPYFNRIDREAKKRQEEEDNNNDEEEDNVTDIGSIVDIEAEEEEISKKSSTITEDDDTYDDYGGKGDDGIITTTATARTIEEENINENGLSMEEGVENDIRSSLSSSSVPTLQAHNNNTTNTRINALEGDDNSIRV